MASVIQPFKCDPEYYGLAVISCGIDHQLQSVMITKTLSQCTKNLVAVCILDKGLRVLRILRSSLTFFAKIQERLVWYDLSAGQSYMVLFIISCRIKVDISVENIE